MPPHGSRRHRDRALGRYLPRHDIATWFLDILGPALSLPDVARELALTAHYGQPMLGEWDASGIVASLALGVAGVLVGAWGFERRDLGS